MSVQNNIKDKLIKALKPTHLEVINESDMHNVPEGSESHFKVIVASSDFIEKSRVNQQRLVNEVLKEELSGPVHALAMRTFTPDEWEQREKSNEFKSPDCSGGAKNKPR